MNLEKLVPFQPSMHLNIRASADAWCLAETTVILREKHSGLCQRKAHHMTLCLSFSPVQYTVSVHSDCQEIVLYVSSWCFWRCVGLIFTKRPENTCNPLQQDPAALSTFWPMQNSKNPPSPKLSSFLKLHPAFYLWTGFKAPGQWNDGVMWSDYTVCSYVLKNRAHSDTLSAADRKASVI